MNKRKKTAKKPAPKKNPKVNYRALLKAYMRRVIDLAGAALITEGMAYTTPELKPKQLAELEKIEREVRTEGMA